MMSTPLNSRLHRSRTTAPLGLARSLCLVLLSLAAGQAAADHPGRQSLDAIRQAAESFVLASLPQGGEDSTVHAGQLDNRLHLPACTLPLEAFNSNHQPITGNTSVGVRCSGDRPWTIYVPVRVTRQARIVALARSLPRGAMIEPHLIQLQKADLSTLGSGFFTDPAEVTGQTLRRAASAGTVLTPTLLEIPPSIRRGEQVTLMVQRGEIQVRAPGLALNDGRIGDRIQVRNLSSERQLEGRVRGPGQVELQGP